jgi:hypothetical protein
MTKLNLFPPDIEPKFSLGIIVLTTEAFRRLLLTDICTALVRHSQCDWGKVSGTDLLENEAGFKHGFRIHSVYHDRRGVEFWIITDDGHKTTTVLLPDDY